jgi:hypothetical protein
MIAIAIGIEIVKVLGRRVMSTGSSGEALGGKKPSLCFSVHNLPHYNHKSGKKEDHDVLNTYIGRNLMMERSNSISTSIALIITSTAATGIVVGWGCSYLYLTQTGRKQRKLQSQIVPEVDHPDAIKTELTSRVRTFFGENGFKRLENAYVIVSVHCLS